MKNLMALLCCGALAAAPSIAAAQDQVDDVEPVVTAVQTSSLTQGQIAALVGGVVLIGLIAASGGSGGGGGSSNGTN